MKVFISYSTDDTALVRQIADSLRPSVEEVFWWDESKRLGEPAWDSIRDWIVQADLVVVLITDNAVRRGMSIGKEIAYADSSDTRIIPLIGPNVNTEYVNNVLEGRTFQTIDPHNPDEAIEAVRNEILQATAGSEINKISDDEEVGWLGVISIIVGAFAVAWLMSKGSEVTESA